MKSRQKENPLVLVNNILLDGSACTGDIVIPDGVERLEGNLFGQCKNLSSVTIPESVVYIDDLVFYNCKSNFVICADEGSCAQEYAERRRIPFQIKEEKE